MTPAQDPSQALPSAAPTGGTIDPAAVAMQPHNFDVQRELHQRIRNDPDYDDWEYGTEPLPQESQAWVAAQKAHAGASDPASGAGSLADPLS